MAAKALAKSSAKQWTTADWGFSLETWTRMNLVLWHMMFIEGVSPSDIMEVR
jgi:hypothetical protein